MVSITKDLSLKPVKIEDQLELFKLMEEVYKSAYENLWTDSGNWYLKLCYGIENLKKELSSEISHYFFVKYQGKTSGILKFDFPISPKVADIPNAMKLHRLYLDQLIHGTGVAKQLMEYVEKIAKENSLENVWLEAMVEKQQARRFYEKMGYEWVFTYHLDFERLLPDVRQIQIMKKRI